jgi:hypothetical protein
VVLKDLPVLKDETPMPIRVRNAIVAWLVKAAAREVAQTANKLAGSGSPQSIITASIKQVNARKQIRSPLSYSTDLIPAIPPSIPSLGSFLTPPVKMGF